jgi:uncharacterized protein (DUF2147 family)
VGSIHEQSASAYLQWRYDRRRGAGHREFHRRFLAAGDGNARVRIEACGSQVCATNLWIGDTSGGVGDKLVMTLSPQPDGSFTGTAYDPKRGRSYALTIRASSNRRVTRGCIPGRLLCRDVNWTAAR